MTREEELLQLQSLLECVEDIGLSGELLSEGGREKLPTLIVQIPTEEEGKTRTMVCNFLPLEDKVKYAKYLQMYMEASDDASGEPDFCSGAVLLAHGGPQKRRGQ